MEHDGVHLRSSSWITRESLTFRRPGWHRLGKREGESLSSIDQWADLTDVQSERKMTATIVMCIVCKSPRAVGPAFGTCC